MDIRQQIEKAKIASRTPVAKERVNEILVATADALVGATDAILRANSADLRRMNPSDPKYDRLHLTPDRIAAIAADMRQVASLPSPLGKTLARWSRPNGMTIRKVSVPFGVIGVIYESRPNVTADVFSLCFKAGSACVLKGGHDAADSNAAIVRVVHNCLRRFGVDTAMLTLLPPPHEAADVMLSAVGLIDVIIPRGGRRLIDMVRQNSRVPVIETGAGVCHTYLHDSGSPAVARDLVLNAKTRRVSVCNALDTFIIDRSRLMDLHAVVSPLADHGVTIHADPEAFQALEGRYPLLVPMTPDDCGREWLDYKMTVVTVDGIDQAIDFIDRFGSHHSECIVATDPAAIAEFQNRVDAACVYANVSTAFTDGAQFGFGAELGISTQKLHARGPMALPEITTYKYLINGDGQTRT